ncbi:MAG: dihydropteroate synthase [Lentisphaeria bacterium]|nr:dihydropteroate synthase [Lentisphaeria bacterium]
MFFRDREFLIEAGKPAIMGILNATPDSFSDGNTGVDSKIEALLTASPDIIDIGGESTRPGAPCVPQEEEVKRILPVVRRIREQAPEVLISIDTRKSYVAKYALEAGADIINDVSCLHFDPELADVAAKYSAGLILNHSRGTPETMNLPENLSYPSGLVEMVRDELTEAAEFAISRGVRRESIILDPGFGFSKDTQQNLELLGRPEKLLSLGYPLLSGPSRKRFIGELTGESDPAARDYGTCGAVIASALAGYAVIRVHNVKAAKDCLSVFYGCQKKAKNL